MVRTHNLQYKKIVMQKLLTNDSSTFLTMLIPVNQRVKMANADIYIGTQYLHLFLRTK